MNVTREEIYGYSGSSIFCLLFALFLFVTYIETTIKPAEVGVLVNFGTVDISTGTFEPRSGPPPGGGGNRNDQVAVQQPAQNQSQQTVQPSVQRPAQTATQQTSQAQRPATQPKTQNNTTTPVITQNLENTAAVEAARKEQEAKETARREQEERDRIAAAEQRTRDAISQQVSGAFGSGAAGSNQQGSGAYGTDPNGVNQRGTGTSGTGVQGDPSGTTQAGSPTGTGYGEFNLGGRTLRGEGGLPRPEYTAQEEGRIVINITVNPSGDVVFAEIGRGTTIDNTSMRRSALDAARKATFGKSTTNNNQSGTITYWYRLK